VKGAALASGARIAQIWIELRSDDPAAVSTLGVARARLEAGRGLARLRRWRLIEIEGRLPGAEEIALRVHASTWFYNPHKELATVRTDAAEGVPVPRGCEALLVIEHGGARRAAAERWWRHETGRRVTVREGVVWGLAFEPAVDAGRAADDLMTLRGREHGLFANPHAQTAARAHGPIPLGWIAEQEPRAREARP
jgi:hypothetical protein